MARNTLPTMDNIMRRNIDVTEVNTNCKFCNSVIGDGYLEGVLLMVEHTKVTKLLSLRRLRHIFGITISHQHLLTRNGEFYVMVCFKLGHVELYMGKRTSPSRKVRICKSSQFIDFAVKPTLLMGLVFFMPA